MGPTPGFADSASSLDGRWRSQKFGEVSFIKKNILTWPNGRTVLLSMFLDGDAVTSIRLLEGTANTANVRGVGSRLEWDDDDVWIREPSVRAERELEAEGQLQVGMIQSDRKSQL